MRRRKSGTNTRYESPVKIDFEQVSEEKTIIGTSPDVKGEQWEAKGMVDKASIKSKS